MLGGELGGRVMTYTCTVLHWIFSSIINKRESKILQLSH